MPAIIFLNFSFPKKTWFYQPLLTLFLVMNCRCCSGKVLRHIGRNGLYWYCPSCRQTMPVSEEVNRLFLQPDVCSKSSPQGYIF